MSRPPRAPRHALLALAALLLCGGCNDFLDPSGDNPYSGGSIPTGKGPVTAAGFVVDASSGARSVLSGASVAMTDSSGKRLTNRTDRRGVFYIDGLQPGLVAFEVTRAGYAPFEVSVDAPAGRWITAVIALLGRDGAPDMAHGGDYGDFEFDVPEEMQSGDAPVAPTPNEVTEDYAAYASYVCVSDAVVLDADAALIPLEAGQAELHGFLAGAHFQETVTVRSNSGAAGRLGAR